MLLSLVALGDDLIKARYPGPDLVRAIRRHFPLQALVIGSAVQAASLIDIDQILQPGPLRLRFSLVHSDSLPCAEQVS